jgi:hypothetical protein
MKMKKFTKNLLRNKIVIYFMKKCVSFTINKPFLHYLLYPEVRQYYISKRRYPITNWNGVISKNNFISKSEIFHYFYITSYIKINKIFY